MFDVAPNDSPCGVCGRENNQYDDVGWFYRVEGSVHPLCTDFEILRDNKYYVPYCSKCGIPNTCER